MLRALRLEVEHLDELGRALSDANLVASDIAQSGQTFWRFDDDLGLAGFGGIDGTGADRLLRSLLVTPARRDKGLGRAMLASLEAHAKEAGVARLHLLTNTAASFFRANGYGDSQRAFAPATVAASAEFASLCPVGAIYMVKLL